MGSQGQGFYSDEEAERILRLAASKTGAGGVTRQSLLQSAAELGISPEALEEAERAVMEQRSRQEDLAEFDAYQKREFAEHLTAFLSVNAFLVCIDLWTNQFWIHGLHPTWSMLPIFGWGIGLFFDAVSTFVKSSSGYRQEFETWRKRRDKKARKAAKAQAETTDPLLDRLMLEDLPGRVELARRLREETGLGPREAKEAVDDYATRHPGLLT